ncbi:MAG: YihY/virulence factor BrkB family protein [Bacteroidota bacterium]|nr:YihY/virulence factor BrkB family protein [Bacteroidota bacterium]
MRERLEEIPILKNFVRFLDSIEIPAYPGFSIYDLLEIYFSGIIKGVFSARAGSVSFSFFMALFPFLLFILNLIPFIPIENFDIVFFSFVLEIIPFESQGFFMDIFNDIQQKPRGGLLSSVFALSIFLTANGVYAVFERFEESYHVDLFRDFLPQYLFSIFVAILLGFLFLFSVAIFVFFEVYFIQNISDITLKIDWIRYGQLVLYVLVTYISVAILYYFGTIEGKKARFFSPGAFMTTLLIAMTTKLFGIYITHFPSYNQLYGSIGALLILMFYIWLNSIILLLGFELNATLTHFKKSKE